MVGLLWLGARRMGPAARADDRFRRRWPRIVAASAIMGACLVAAEVVLGPALGLPFWRYLALAVLVGVGILSYFGTGAMIGAFRLSDITGNMRRQR